MKINELRILIQEIIAEEYSDPTDGDKDFDMESYVKANEYYDKGWDAYSEGDFLKAERYYKDALKAGNWLGWTEKDLPPYESLNENKTPSKDKDKPETKEMTWEELLAAVKKMVTDKQKAAQIVNAIKEGLNENLNEGFFGPSKKDIADFEAELEALIKEKGLENAPNLEKMKTDVRAIAKTSSFKGGKLGYQAAGISKRTGNKIAPQFYYSTDSTTTGR